MSQPPVLEVVESYAAGLAEARTEAGNRGTALQRLQAKLDSLPDDAAGLAEELGIDPADGADALQRKRELQQRVKGQLDLVNQQICFLDQGIRQRNNPELDEFTRLVFMKNYLRIGTSGDPITAEGYVNWTSQLREARNTLHDRYQTGMLRVGYGTARFVGSMTGASDMIALVYGVSDEGKPLGWEMRAAAFLSLVGGAILSDAATSAHLRNVVANRSPTPNARPPKSAPRADTDAAGDAPIATSQTSNLPSGTEADLAAMGIPQANFDKMQAYLFEHNGHVALRPTGVDAVQHLEAGAKPKPVDFKSKTSKGIDGLLGADPTKPGCAAAFDPKTDFFEQAMRNAGMDDAEIASKLDAIRAGDDVDPPPGFNADTWNETLARFQFRKAEWDGAIGDGVRKMVAKGDYEIRDGIIWEVNGPDGPRPVTGDHDPFELWINGRPATPAEEAAFIRAMSADGAGIVHGGHIRFDPKLEDYQPGGRFDMKLDPESYSPAQIEAKTQAKYEADRNIYEVIMEKHSRQALPDEVLQQMDGFEPPARSHYPDGPYGDMRFQQDTALHQRWQDLQAGRPVAPEVTNAEVLVLIGPTGRPAIMRAGETPAGVPKPATVPVEIGPVKPGSSGRLPTAVISYGVGGLKTDPITYDDSICGWHDHYDDLLVASAPTCACDDDALIATALTPAAAAADDAASSVLWKVLVGALAVVALVIGAIVVFTGGGDGDTVADESVTEVAEPVVTADPVPETAPRQEEPAATTAPTSEPPLADESVPAPPPVATGVAVAMLCGVTTHSPAAQFLASPSWFLLTLYLLTVAATTAQGIVRVDAVPVDDPSSLDGATITIQTPGADLAEVTAAVDANGVVAAVVPISSFGPYDFPSATVTTADGRVLPVIDPLPSVTVDAAEGPMGGCTPAGDLTDQQRADFAAFRFPPAAPPADDAPSAAGNLDAQVDAFIADFVAAHAAGDAATLVDALHPAVIDRHGVEVCTSFVTAATGSVEALSATSVVAEPWEYPFEGQTTAIPDSITVIADGTFGGNDLSVELHLAPVGDDLAWFANCTP